MKQNIKAYFSICKNTSMSDEVQRYGADLGKQCISTKSMAIVCADLLNSPLYKIYLSELN